MNAFTLIQFLASSMGSMRMEPGWLYWVSTFVPRTIILFLFLVPKSYVEINFAAFYIFLF